MVAGVSSLPPSKSTTEYDERGRVFRTHVYSIDPGGAGVGRDLTTDHWYDGRGLTIKTAAPGRKMSYDSAGRAYLFTSYSAASGGSVRNQVQREFNGFGQVTVEYQHTTGAVNTSTTPKVQYGYSTSGNHSRLTSMTFPSTQVLTYLYTGGDDTISRLSGLDYDSDTIEEYTYLGLNTVVKRAQPEADIEMTYIDVGTGDAGDQYAGLDRFGRIANLTWKEYGSSTVKLDHFKYGYDRNGNRLYRTNELDHTFDELYHADGNAGYDSLNQLQEFQRGTLSDGYGSDGILDTVSTSSRSQSWTMDGLGNFPTVTTDGVSQTRTHDKQNKLTEVTVTGSSTSTLDYDAAGNMITDELGNEYKYDAWNRLIVFGPSQRRWLYDALGRRNRVIYQHASSANYIRNFYYTTNWQLIEEQTTFGGYGEKLQYVWTPGYVDGLVARFQDTDGNGSFDEILYAMTDANWNVVGLVFGSGGSIGTVAERYVYDPYGRFDTLDASRSARTTTLYTWDIYHQGGRFDRAIGLYHFRRRDYSPTLMRWVGMDPIGFCAGDSDFYRYESNSPIQRLDPSGLKILCDGMADAICVQSCKQGGFAHGQCATIVDYTIWWGIFPVGRHIAIGCHCYKTVDGDCTAQEKQALQAQVDAYCKNPTPSCNKKQIPQRGQCQALLDTMARALTCVLLRERLNNRCYRGGDFGHKQGATDTMNAAAECSKRYSDECRGNPPGGFKVPEAPPWPPGVSPVPPPPFPTTLY